MEKLKKQKHQIQELVLKPSNLIKLCLLSLAIFFLPMPALAAVQTIGNEPETILSYQNTSAITKEGGLLSEEKIIYDFGTNQKHGIFRIIPTLYTPRFGDPRQSLKVISVTDEKGITLPVNISGLNRVTIKIGDENKLVTGIKEFNLKYEVKRVISSEKNNDIFRWNFIGDGWSVPIEKAEITLKLPQGYQEDEIKSECFRGNFGSPNPCTLSKPLTQGENIYGYIYNQDSLSSNQAMTVQILFPNSSFPKPSTLEIFIWEKPWYLFLPIISFLLIFILWYKKGRDPKGDGTIIPQYSAPEGLEPAEASIVTEGKLDNHGLSAQIIYLATLGQIKIKRTEEKGLIGKKVDYELTKLKEIREDMKPFNQTLISALFSGGTTIKLSSLDTKFAADHRRIKKEIYKSVISANFYKSNPMVIKSLYLLLSSVIIIIGLIISTFLALNIVGYVSLVAPGAIMAGFSFIMPTRTKKGAQMKEYLLGLREYIKVAEIDRIKFHNAPKKNPAKFEELLPYAMLFHLEKEWAEQFNDIYKNPPDWYVGNYTTINAIMLTTSLHDFSSTTSSTFTSVTGSSGGGFSGGGGGGGGGGSW